MLLSRRSTLGYASVATVFAASPIPLSAQPLAGACDATASAQLVHQLVIHPDEVDGTSYCAPLALSATDTAWHSSALLTNAAFRAAQTKYRLRGYGLRRVNAFQTRQGVRYAAVWQLGRKAPVKVRHDMTLAEFGAASAQAARQGYAIEHVDACATRAGARFAALWKKGGAAQRIFSGLTAAAYDEQRAALAREGFRPLHVAGYGVQGEARFAAVFEKSAGLARETHLAVLGWDFPAHARAMAAQGLRLKDASGYAAQGLPYYATVWERA